jgi:hypothetical protein
MYFDYGKVKHTVQLFVDRTLAMYLSGESESFYKHSEGVIKFS